MPSLWSLLSLLHLIGLAGAVGAATAKMLLLLRCRSDRAFLPAYLQVAPTLTRLIVTGLLLLTATGVGWLLLGYGLPNLLIAKLVLVLAIWVLGPIIDKVAEPAFRQLASQPGGADSPAFPAVQRRYVAIEVTATLLFYAVIVLWVLGQ